MFHGVAPDVTILCTAYAQKNYPRCRRDILKRKTAFGVEIKIYYDLSTASTPAITADHARTHPGIVIPVIQ